MNLGRAVLDLVTAVAALIAAAWFVHFYSQTAALDLRQQDADLTKACTVLRDFGVYTMALPVFIAVAGATMIALRKELAAHFLCQSAWVFALILVCFTLDAWRISEVHRIGPLAPPPPASRPDVKPDAAEPPLEDASYSRPTENAAWWVTRPSGTSPSNGSAMTTSGGTPSIQSVG